MNSIILKNVRLSFPSIFQKEVFNGVEGKYAATFILNPNHEAIDIINKSVKDLLIKKKLKLTSDKICLKKGDVSEYYDDEDYFIKASNTRKGYGFFS